MSIWVDLALRSSKKKQLGVSEEIVATKLIHCRFVKWPNLLIPLDNAYQLFSLFLNNDFSTVIIINEDNYLVLTNDH